MTAFLRPGIDQLELGVSFGKGDPKKYEGHETETVLEHIQLGGYPYVKVLLHIVFSTGMAELSFGLARLLGDEDEYCGENEAAMFAALAKSICFTAEARAELEALKARIAALKPARAEVAG